MVRLPRVQRMIAGALIRCTLGYHRVVPSALGRVGGSIATYADPTSIIGPCLRHYRGFDIVTIVITS